MGIYLDEPLAVMAATALTVTGAVVGAWWQRRRAALPDVPPHALDPRLIDARLDRLEQIAETTALEVERVAEGQRFTTRLLSERAVAREVPSVAPGRPTEHRTPH